MGWKTGVHETEHAEPCFNGLVFATQEEAERYGAELFSRWLAPHHWSTHEVVDEEPTHRFGEYDNRAVSLAGKEQG